MRRRRAIIYFSQTTLKCVESAFLVSILRVCPAMVVSPHRSIYVNWLYSECDRVCVKSRLKKKNKLRRTGSVEGLLHILPCVFLEM